MAEVAYYTKEGLEKLKEELQYLKTTGRSIISKAIAEARDKGDFQKTRNMMPLKKRRVCTKLKYPKCRKCWPMHACLMNLNWILSKVLALSIVKIKNVKNGATMSYQLVSENEADLKAGKISVASPIAKGLLGKKVGEITEITVLQVKWNLRYWRLVVKLIELIRLIKLIEFKLLT